MALSLPRPPRKVSHFSRLHLLSNLIYYLYCCRVTIPRYEHFFDKQIKLTSKRDSFFSKEHLLSERWLNNWGFMDQPACALQLNEVICISYPFSEESRRGRGLSCSLSCIVVHVPPKETWTGSTGNLKAKTESRNIPILPFVSFTYHRASLKCKALADGNYSSFCSIIWDTD